MSSSIYNQKVQILQPRFTKVEVTKLHGNSFQHIHSKFYGDINKLVPNLSVLFR